MISRNQIFDKTCYGLDLYSHIIHQACPGGRILKVSFPDSGCWPNPFDEGRDTLHITVAKERPEAKLSRYIAHHHDESGHIPDGTAIDLAELYYGLKNQPLLEHINKEMYLHIGETFNQYDRKSKTEQSSTPLQEPEDLPEASATDLASTQETPRCTESITVSQPEPQPETSLLSYYRKPVFNKVPHSSITLRQMYRYIISDRAKEATAKLRTIQGKTQRQNFKAKNFDYVTPAGTFSIRNAADIIEPSGYMVIDVDDLNTQEQVEATFQMLLGNRRLETLLLFRSPSGNGVKWIIRIVNNEGHDYLYFFKAVTNYLGSLGIKVDQSGKDISRACYLPHDPNAYINELCL